MGRSYRRSQVSLFLFYPARFPTDPSPSYLATQHDVDVLVRAVRITDRIAHTLPMANLTDTAHQHPNLDHNIGLLDDAKLSEIVRTRSETIHHLAGTCAMGSVDNNASVLDPQMKVKGVSNLRVCDASIFPKIVSGHTVRFSLLRMLCTGSDVRF